MLVLVSFVKFKGKKGYFMSVFVKVEGV